MVARSAVLSVILALAIGVAVPASRSADDDYSRLLGLAQAAPHTADFLKLRLALAASPTYQPYRRYPDSDRSLKEAVDARDWDRVLAIALTSLEQNYLRIRPHFLAWLASTRRGDTDRATYHRHFFEGLYRSIVEGVDGRTIETAFRVIDVEEEHDVLMFRDLHKRAQSLVEHAGRRYDRLEVQERQGEPFVLFFDVTLPFSRSPFGTSPAPSG